LGGASRIGFLNRTPLADLGQASVRTASALNEAVELVQVLAFALHFLDCGSGQRFGGFESLVQHFVRGAHHVVLFLQGSEGCQNLVVKLVGLGLLDAHERIKLGIVQLCNMLKGLRPILWRITLPHLSCFLFRLLEAACQNGEDLRAQIYKLVFLLVLKSELILILIGIRQRVEILPSEPRELAEPRRDPLGPLDEVLLNDLVEQLLLSETLLIEHLLDWVEGLVRTHFLQVSLSVTRLQVFVALIIQLCLRREVGKVVELGRDCLECVVDGVRKD
jgi:hypothetical protein